VHLPRERAPAGRGRDAVMSATSTTAAAPSISAGRGADDAALRALRAFIAAPREYEPDRFLKRSIPRRECSPESSLQSVR
jgi:hypothetical protein